MKFRAICDRISHNKASTHTKSNLRFYQKWNAGLIHALSYSTLYFLQDWQVWFLWQLSSDPVKATNGRLVPLNGHGFVIMVSLVCSELGLHRELANSVLSQFGVIWGPWSAQTWPLDSNRLLASFYTPYNSVLSQFGVIWGAMECPNLASGFQSSSCFILYPL